MAMTDFSNMRPGQTGWSDNVVTITTTDSTDCTLSLGQYYPKVDGLPPEVKEMLQEKRKRVYALKMLLKTEEESLRVYERMLGE